MPEEPEKQVKPRRRWKRWFLGFFVVLIVGLLWANGPGARWAIRTFLPPQLEKLQLTGTFQVKGSLTSGLSLHNVSLTGKSKIQKIDSNLLKIEWSLSSLLKKQIEALTLDRLHLVIDLKAPDIPKNGDDGSADQEKDPGALGKTLELVRNLLDPSHIKITDLLVEVRETATISLASLSHQPGEATYLFTEFNASNIPRGPIHNPLSTLTWTKEEFRLDRFTILPTLSIHDLRFALNQEASVGITLADSEFSLNSDLTKNHSLILKSPTLAIRDITALIDPELPASGVITALEIDTQKGLINLQGRDLQWAEQKLATASIEAHTPDLIQPFEQPIELKIDLADQLVVDGTVLLRKEVLDSDARLNFTLRDDRIPTITGEIAYDAREARLLASALDGVRVNGSYFVDSKTYQARAIADLPDASLLEKRLTGPLKFSLTGSGDIPAKTHNGTLNLDSLTLNQPNLPTATSNGKISWNWPESVTVEQLQMDAPEGRLESKLSWSNDTLVIDQLSLTESTTQLLSISGKLPAPLKFPGLDEFLDSTEPISLTVKSQPLTFKKLATFAPLPDSLIGIVQADLNLAGSLSKPSLNGFATLDDFRLKTQPKIPPATVRLEFKTDNDKLFLTANAKEPGGPLIDVEGELPFLPRAWIDRKTNPTESPIRLRAFSPSLDLRRVSPFVPAIKSVTGNLKLDFLASGTLAKPNYSGTAKANITRMRIADSPISDLRDAKFNVAFKGTTVTISPSSVSASGGSVKLNGTIELGGEEPVFDIAASGKYFLLNRTADYTFRGNPNLRLRGPFSSATLSGSVGIVESLFYKDVEILPFGVPRTTEIPRPNLPTFTQKAAPKSPTKKPGGVNDWKLDLSITTEDPILIRGNLAEGKVTGTVKVFGTIGNPKTSGTLITEGLVADLPFSDLKVQSGVVTLRPEALTNPVINLRGSSTVGQYTVQVYLTGPVQNPNLLLTSNPPLPENEIMLLLATGSASAQLEDRQVASQKALQYLLEGIRRRNGDKDKTVLQRLLKNSDQIELSLGDTNQFSGRNYSSASLEISDSWNFTTQIDEQGQTRALVVFSIRFR